MDFFVGGGASGDLPDIRGEKITQTVFGPIGVKSGFHAGREEGDRAICLDKNDIVEGFFLPRAPGVDDVVVDLRCRYNTRGFRVDEIKIELIIYDFLHRRVVS